MNGILPIAHLTWIEARRRRIVLAGVLCGLGFLLLFGLIVYFNAERAVGPLPALQRRIVLQTLTIVGMYAVNFLVVALAVMLPVDTLSGEIDSGVIQTLAAKPVRRAEIVFGKWLVFWLMIGGYIVLMAGGLVGIMWLLTGFRQQNLLPALGLMQLEATVLIGLTMAGGARFTTITNGIVAFGFYAVAFVGGLVEQIGLLARNDAARYIGTAISLFSPADALWRKATHMMLPPFITQVQVTPFSGGAVPSTAMVWWGVLFSLVMLALAVRGFNKRAL